jgi:Zincin-like metallopeptidase
MFLHRFSSKGRDIVRGQLRECDRSGTPGSRDKNVGASSVIPAGPRRDFKQGRMRAAEECCAELSAAFLCPAHGFDFCKAMSPSYLDHWLRVLKADNRALFSLASHASHAADWLRERVHAVTPAPPNASGQKGRCDPQLRGGPMLLQSDLKLNEWLVAAILGDDTGTANFSHFDPKTDDVLTHEVTFEIVTSGSLTPTWTLTRAAAPVHSEPRHSGRGGGVCGKKTELRRSRSLRLNLRGLPGG